MGIAVRILLLLSVGTLVALGLVVLARVTYKRHGIRGTDDIEVTYVTALATLYGIFIAFMIFIVWQKYNVAQDAVEAEANKVVEFYRIAGGLDNPLKDRFHSLAIKYSGSVVEQEWDAMRSGAASPRTQQRVGEVWKQLNLMTPDTVRDPVLRDHLLTSWSSATDFRRLRLELSATGLPTVAYALLAVGGLLTLGMACLCTNADFRVHLIKSSVLGSLIVFMLGVVFALDHPFSSAAVRVLPTPFVRTLQVLHADEVHR